MARCAAIIAADHKALSALLDDELIHVHGTGGIDDKTAYLRGIGGKYDFHFIERGPLDFRFAQGCAVMVGALHQSFTDIETGTLYTVKGVTTQVWRQANDGPWRQVALHNNFIEVVKSET